MMKIAIVYDKIQSEKEQRMISAVQNVLSLEYCVQTLEFDEEFMRKVKPFDFVFNLSIWGGKEMRQIHVPAILDVLGIGYTSSNAFTHAMCMDKIKTKILMDYYHVSTPVFQVFEEGEIPIQIDKTYFVKPSREGSAVGIHKNSVVIEGKEVTVGLLGNGKDLEVLPILEIDFSYLPPSVENFYSFEVKHPYGEQTKYHCPARLDVRIRGEECYFIDINSMPQVVPNYSDLFKMAEAAGYSYSSLIFKIIHTAIQRTRYNPS